MKLLILIKNCFNCTWYVNIESLDDKKQTKQLFRDDAQVTKTTEYVLYNLI